MKKKEIIKKEDAHNYCRFLYEIEGKHIVDIAKMAGVATTTVFNWKKKENWLSKGEKKEDLVEFTRQRMMEAAIAQGMTPEKIMQHTIEGIVKPEKYDLVINSYGKKESKKSKDYKTAQKFQETFYKVTGLIGATQSGIEVNNNAEGSVNVQVNLPSFEEDKE